MPPIPSTTMDQKHSTVLETPNMYSPSRSRRRLSLALLALPSLLVFTILFNPWNLAASLPGCMKQPFPASWMRTKPAVTLKPKVRLEAHIMSKCPDARDCLRDLVVPAMERVHNIVDFKLSFIGTPTEHDDGIACMHGPSECLGNMLELCAAAIYPDPKIYLGFTLCLSQEYAYIPKRDLVEDCALEHGVDFGKLNDCVSRDDGYAQAMLRESVRRSSAAGVTRSCTIRLEEQFRCIRDNGEWKDCEGGHEVSDLVRDIKAIYGEDSPVYKEDLPLH